MASLGVSATFNPPTPDTGGNLVTPPDGACRDRGEIHIALASATAALGLVAVLLGAIGVVGQDFPECQYMAIATRRTSSPVPATTPSTRPACEQAPVGPLPQIAGQVIAYAHAQLGKPYLWGATGPNAFDCSGLTMMAYRSAGISIPRVTFDQWTFGTQIRVGQEYPGDLAFFNSGPNSGPGRPGHVGIVLNPQTQQMIVAPSSGDRVKIASYQRDDLMGFTRLAGR